MTARFVTDAMRLALSNQENIIGVPTAQISLESASTRLPCMPRCMLFYRGLACYCRRARNRQVRRMKLDEYQELVEAIYDDVLESAGFSGALRSFQRVFKTEQAWLVVWDKSHDLIKVDGTAGLIPELTKDYESHYQFEDPAKSNFSTIKVGHWWLDSEQMGLSRMQSSAFHQEFLRSYEMRSYMGSPVLRTSCKEVALSFLRAQSRGVFTRADTRSLDAVIPHLQRGIHIRERIKALSAATLLSSEILQTLSFGVAVIDSQMKVVLHNRIGEAWLRWIGPSSKWASRKVADCTFREMLLSVAYPRSPRIAQAAILRAPSLGSCHMVVLPLRADHHLSAPWQSPVALVVFCQARRASPILSEVLRTLYRLTPAECRLAGKMIDGAKLRDIADALGIRIETARTALKSILQKTNMHSQPQLIHMLSILSNVGAPPR